MTSLRTVVAAALLPLVWVPAALAQPAPRWVEMADLGDSDARLKGIEAPLGVKVEIVGDIPGALERDVLLVHESWSYLASGGRLIRRRQHDAAFLKAAQSAAEGKMGPPTAASDDAKWIEQQLMRGLSDKGPAAIGGLAAGRDGWLYLSIGGTANRPESWDGSKATVLGSGAIFRFQPDGSRMQEFARGFAGPVGPPACDALGVGFQVDRTPTGSRLIHVLEGADFGWRTDRDDQQLDRPGTLTAMLTSDAHHLGGAIVYAGAAFPKPFQRLLIAPDAAGHAVRAFSLEPSGATLAVGEQFDLLRSEADAFHPAQALQGPDGAIYFAQAAGPLLRLTWSGTKSMPALPLAKPDAPAVSAARPDELAATALDGARTTAERAKALMQASRQWNGDVLDACLKLLQQDDADLARLAADALGDHVPDDKATQEKMAGLMQDELLRAALPARRSLYIALGKLGTKLETVPEWIFEATSVTPDAQANRYLFDGHVRALEMPKGWGTELLIGNLEVALFDPNPEPEERQRLKKFVVATAEVMRTRELAEFLDRAIRDEKDYFSKIEAPLQVRLLAAYRNVLVEPPIRADAVAAWLEKHPAATPEVQRSAWETLAAVGTAKPETLVTLARALVNGKTDPAVKQAAAKALAPHLQPGKPGEIDELVKALQAP